MRNYNRTESFTTTRGNRKTIYKHHANPQTIGDYIDNLKVYKYDVKDHRFKSIAHLKREIAKGKKDLKAMKEYQKYKVSKNKLGILAKKLNLEGMELMFAAAYMDTIALKTYPGAVVEARETLLYKVLDTDIKIQDMTDEVNKQIDADIITPHQEINNVFGISNKGKIVIDRSAFMKLAHQEARVNMQTLGETMKDLYTSIQLTNK